MEHQAQQTACAAIPRQRGRSTTTTASRGRCHFGPGPGPKPVEAGADPSRSSQCLFAIVCSLTSPVASALGPGFLLCQPSIYYHNTPASRRPLLDSRARARLGLRFLAPSLILVSPAYHERHRYLRHGLGIRVVVWEAARALINWIAPASRLPLRLRLPGTPPSDLVV